jgi:hypothetical protein
MSGGLSNMLIERYRDGSSDLLLYLTLVVPIRGRAIPIVGIGNLLVGELRPRLCFGWGFDRWRLWERPPSVS